MDSHFSRERYQEEKAAGEEKDVKNAPDGESHDTSRRHLEENEASKENDVEYAPDVESHDTGSPQQRKNKWFDAGYAEPASRSTEVANLAILDAKNYEGLKHLDVDTAKLFIEHELPKGYHIIECIGRGAFGCCFLIQKGGLQMVLKVVLGNITPRHPVRFYKTCSEYTLLISHIAFPLKLINLKFIIGILKYHHTKHRDIHGNLHSGNMMYFPKDTELKMFSSRFSEVSRKFPRTSTDQATLDFQGEWFSMEDVVITSIIDADIGGKIGEAKNVVNNLHHDPRNHTWEISDDLIGLMNWVVLECGFSLRSHPQRGFVYGIIPEHLQILYELITNTYISLDSNFIFTSVFATEEPFELNLEEGESYFDDLPEVKGPFLKLQSLKGSYSRPSSSAGTATSFAFV